jgi:hypothetical protein
MMETTTTNASLLFVDASTDRFGIGHSSPATLIHVADTLAGSPVIARIENFSTSANSDAALDLKTPNQNYTLKAVRSSARFDFETDGTPRLSITAAGLVGIGTSAPGSNLDLAGTTSRIRWDLNNAYTLATHGNAAFSAFASSVQSAADYQFQIAGITKMSLDASGRVGIGTTTPDKNLVVNQSSPGADVGIRIKNNTTTDAGTTASLRFTTSTGDFDTAALIADRATGSLRYEYGGSEKARLTFDGKLLVGTSSARSNVYIGGNSTTPLIQSETSGSTYNNGASLLTYSTVNYAPILTLGTSNSDTAGTNAAVGLNYVLGFINFVGNDGTNFRSGAWISAAVDGSVSTGDLPTRLTFSTTADGASSPTERMRIRNTGQVDVFGAANTGFYVRTAGAANSSDALIVGTYSATDTTNGTASFIVRPNGNVENTNNSYGAISDIKLKENIVDANSQWDDIKALRPVNYNFKEGQTHTQLGLIAQEVELVSPGLVSESSDRDEDGNDLGTVTKSVNYSVLYMKAVKALQEAMERIETLEAKVAALETK